MSEQSYLTKEGLKNLKNELENLQTVKRIEIAKRIQDAKELGDLSENAEYADAKDEQAANAGRILDVQNIIRNVVIIKKTNNSDGVVNIGSTVEFEDEAGNAKKYQIVGSQESDPMLGKISNESPIGNAFLGAKKGDTVEFKAPKGIIKYKIIEVS